LLLSEQVEYLLLGGYAVAYYGHPRATGDMDLWIAATPANAHRVMAAMVKFGFSPASLSEAMFCTPAQVIRMGMPPLRIELLTSVSGLDFAEAYARRSVVNIDGVDVSLVQREDLIANKRAAGRHKDLADVEQLEP
jgi:predicted nucleotidyltransferase